MFIRRKIVRGTAYYSVVENRRVNGKVRQLTVVSLGQCETIDAAIELERKNAKYRLEILLNHKKLKFDLVRRDDGKFKRGPAAAAVPEPAQEVQRGALVQPLARLGRADDPARVALLDKAIVRLHEMVTWAGSHS